MFNIEHDALNMFNINYNTIIMTTLRHLQICL